MITDIINNLESPWNIIAWVGFAISVLFIAWILIKLNNLVFKRLVKKHKGTNLLFLQHLTSIIIFMGIIILVISSFAGFQSLWQTLLGGTAILSAVIAFIAQDIIKDILAGIMLSFHHPFEVGDRISLEDGSTGIVEEMTMRHVVLCPIDTVRYVIPNSKINASKVINYSYHRDNRSAEFNFSIGYTSDMTLARKVIKKAIESSKYSIPGFIDKDGNPKYADVYFMKFADSALILHATVYYDNSTPSAVLIDDINFKVREELLANKIEIPYNYVNVVSVEQEKKTKRTKTLVDESKTQSKKTIDKKVKVKTQTLKKTMLENNKIKSKPEKQNKKAGDKKQIKPAPKTKQAIDKKSKK